MNKWALSVIPALLATVFSTQTNAAELEVKVNIPRLNAAEYHRPYVTIWLERPDQSMAATLAVLYSQETRGADKGTTWLKDIRQWWRKGGRALSMPMDGVSGATRPVGEHTFSFTAGQAPLGTLAAGDYRLVVETAREKGDRELVRIPFSWPARQAEALQVNGERELGAVLLNIKP